MFNLFWKHLLLIFTAFNLHQELSAWVSWTIWQLQYSLIHQGMNKEKLIMKDWNIKTDNKTTASSSVPAGLNHMTGHSSGRLLSANRFGWELVHLNFSEWVSPTSRGLDREQIPRTLPWWSQLSCQHVCDWSETRCLWLRTLPVNQMENQHHLGLLVCFFRGAPVWTDAWAGRMKRKRKGGFTLTMTLFCNLTLQ